MDLTPVSTPTVPTLNQAPQGQSSSIDQIIQLAVNPQSTQTLPAQTTTEHSSIPHLPRVNKSPDLDDNKRPISSSVYDIKHARRQNAFAGAVNGVKHAEQAFQQKKQDDVARNVQQVLNAQHQIDSATTILNNPTVYSKQDLANAKAVLDKNRQYLNDVFTDPKKTKELQKAFDVSFVDPSKNDTPEVKAMVQAHKEFEISKKAGLNVDTPEEKRVQDLANGVANSSGNVDAAHQSGLKVRGVDEPKSDIPSYADQFLSQQQTNIAANPAYAAALKQQEEAAKNAAKIAPSVIGADQRDIANQRTIAARSADNAATNAARIQAATIAANKRLAGVMYTADQHYAAVVDGIQKREELTIKKNQTPAVQEKLLLDNIKAAQTARDQLVKQQVQLETEKTALGKGIDPNSAGGYDEQINITKQRIKEIDQRISDTNLRLSNLGYRGPVANGQSTSNNTNSQEPTDGNSVGSDEEPEPEEDPDEFDTRPQ